MHRAERAVRLACLLAAGPLLLFGLSGPWIEYRILRRCRDHGGPPFCSDRPLADLHGTTGPEAVPSSLVALVMVVVALAVAAAVLHRYSALGGLLVFGGFVLALLPFTVPSRISAEGYSTYYVGTLTPEAYAFVLGGIVLVFLGGMIRSAWVERNIPAVGGALSPPASK